MLATISLTLFIFSAAVTAVLHSRWLYELDMKLLDIPSYAGMSEETIRQNYRALIRYCSLWYRGELMLPTLAVSATGRIHFQECKVLFDAVQLLCILTLITSIFLIHNRRRANDRRYLKRTGLACLLIPLVLGVLAAWNFDRFFTVFHSILFRNDYWLFDPAEDPVILILPETYFMHCAIGILLIVFVCALICLHRSSGRHGRRK